MALVVKSFGFLMIPTNFLPVPQTIPAACSQLPIAVLPIAG